MRIVFAGTPAFAVPTLEALVDAGHDVLAVFTRPDRPAGRGRHVTPSTVKIFALAHGLTVRQPPNMREAAESIEALRPEAMVVAAYGFILPPAILSLPRLGCINVHASLLPRWRGAAPIARAIEAGDAETGVSIMQMDAGLDTGPVLSQTRTPIDVNETSAQVQDRLAQLGAELLVSTLARLERGDITARRQDAAHACYAAKLQKSEALIDWSAPALTLHRKVRALNPWPVARTLLNGDTVMLWEVGALEPTSHGEPGTLLQADAAGIRIAAGSGALTVTRLQAAGGKLLFAREFLNGTRLKPGDRFGT